MQEQAANKISDVLANLEIASARATTLDDIRAIDDARILISAMKMEIESLEGSR